MRRRLCVINAPELNHTDYYNRKGWYSILIQAIVDHQYLFRDICVGWPGSVHDAQVFANSFKKWHPFSSVTCAKDVAYERSVHA